ncbi:DUF6252 family protein [Solitalea lacus]|uniref:DUF6252 family protein n=1 Tax=Solitalea lacus TaxID=2911172 RepID=UPI001EDB65CC|nr:DUF6252 family protein [Solitalea lacus]UKJ06177.1 DUF6252 family protein [Solitalea lacus]
MILPFRIFLLFISIGLISSSCQKDKEKEKVGIDLLPPESHEGKNTFGCLVNGESYLPKGTGGPILTCTYQYIDGFQLHGYYFNLGCGSEKNGKNLGIGIGTNNLEIQEGGIYQLKTNVSEESAYASYGIFTIGNNQIFNPLNGELKITKFDYKKQIVSGTFWFDAANDQGERVEVREGRFDMIFTK